ncbi:hypothetical protein LCGC14_0579820 [marine sediment metagenome]|uniref:Cyclic-phosphate processing Receiver domain-containing protein n=1 Tax=marine sediment metagenome TaxID=412755 RepID=A0A0F9RGP9_9ZZZZ
MKIYLDDTRTCPQGWTLVMSAELAIDMLKQGAVDTISLDHDLGKNKKTGYDVVKWIEKEVATKGFIPPVIKVHTKNPVGRDNILAAIKNIKRLQEN